MRLILAILIVCIIAIFSCVAVRATDFTGSYWTQSINTNISVTTNQTNIIYVENNDYHRIELFGSTNGANIIVASSIDGTNYIPFWTNNWANTNTLSASTNLTGKYGYFKFTEVYTNGTYTINYLGTR